MNDFVKEYEEVIDNVRQFNLDLDSGTSIITQLSQFRHWYYIPELDCFGPSKFIGYKNMTTLRYKRGEGKNGRDTEVILRQWFYVLSEGSEQWQKLFPRLKALLLQHEKKPNKNVRIHVPR